MSAEHETTDRHPPSRGTIDVTDGVLVLVGEIDNVALRAWTACSPGPSPVHLVEASAVTFLGSAGTALIIRAVRACAPRRLVLLDPSRAALRPLQLMGLDDLLDVVPAPRAGGPTAARPTVPQAGLSREGYGAGARRGVPVVGP